MVLKEKNGSGVVVWVIDPFEGKLKPHPFEVRNLLTWMNGIGAEIRPVYVLNLSISNQTEESQNNITLQKTASVESAMRNYLQEIGCPNTFIPKILVTYDTPVGGMIERLIHYCDDIDAEMIVVSSRGRKGFDRFVFGSFAETLLFQSKRPMYFLTHQNGTPTEERSNRVLFPTDFSRHSELVFDALLEQAKASNPEIILYNAVSLPPSVISGDGMIVIPEDYCSKQEEDAKVAAEKWVKKARSLGIKISFVVQSVGVSMNVAPSIIDVAKQRSARFIAMASNSGKMGSIFFGSVAREVFRTNLFPVWICGPRSLIEEKKYSSEAKAASVQIR